jgi:hypothetical protein
MSDIRLSLPILVFSLLCVLGVEQPATHQATILELGSPTHGRAEGHIQHGMRTFKSTNHPKAKGIDLKIEYPASWDAAEGERPNIIQKFRTSNGESVATVMLAVKEIPFPAQNITKKDIEDVFAPETLKAFLKPVNGVYISSTRIKLDGLPGSMMHYSARGQRLDIPVEVRGLNFMVLYENKLITIDCGIAMPGTENGDIEMQFNQYVTVFKQIASSLVVNNQ